MSAGILISTHSGVGIPLCVLAEVFALTIESMRLCLHTWSYVSRLLANLAWASIFHIADSPHIFSAITRVPCYVDEATSHHTSGHGQNVSGTFMKDVVEYAVSSRSTCKFCNVKIEKDTVRIGKRSKGGGGFDVTHWYHPPCYYTSDTTLEPAALLGFSTLRVGDKKKAGAWKTGARKRKGDPLDSSLAQKKQEMNAVDGARWQAALASFARTNCHNTYKGAHLPQGWFGFETIIVGEPEAVEPSSRIAAFDFDGCLANTDVRRSGAREWSLMFPSVPSKLKGFHEQGYKLVIFTNESNIDRFHNSRQKAVDSKIGRLQGLAAAVGVPIQVFIACGKSGTGDPSRKPEAGMWHLLESQLNEGVEIDKGSSFFVGDAAGRLGDHSAADLGFAKAVGIPFLVPEDIFT